MAKHITDRAARRLDRTATKVSGRARTVPGPSTNPATNLLIQSVVLRGIGRLVRRSLEKGVLQRRYDPEVARKIVENRSMVRTLATYGVTAIATRSIPGALLVGGGLALKTLFDRSGSRRKSMREGDADLAEQADD